MEVCVDKAATELNLLTQICGLLDALLRICEQTHRSVFDVTAEVSG